MKKTEAWWFCGECQTPIIKVGKRGFKILIAEHGKICKRPACRIVQLEQSKKKA